MNKPNHPPIDPEIRTARDEDIARIAIFLLQAKLNKDPDWDPSLFEASMLYHRAGWIRDKLAWACKGVAKADKWHQEFLDLDLPEILPFKKAVLVITRQDHLSRAAGRFRLFPRIYAHFDFGGAFGKWPPTARQWEKRTKQWIKNGMPRHFVAMFHAVWNEKDWRKYRIRNRK